MSKLQVWVDADACPKALREILIRFATRSQRHVNFIANHIIPLPQRDYIKFRQVEHGFDIADNFIVSKVQAGDLVITADIPLAAEVIEKGAMVLTSKGHQLTKANIQQRLTMRNFMDTMRSAGLVEERTASMSSGDRQLFANNLDSWLVKTR